jgi:phage shock protein PspC (stress-responsive transcriptional regulator)
MNKTISANIGGTIFNIEERAFNALKRYLDAIAAHFANSEGKDEIMADIEARMAELLTERMGSTRQVVDQTDVAYINQVMGKPEDFFEEADANAPPHAAASDTGTRRLYRDTDKGAIAGVAAGLSHYFGWDPVGLRIAFILLTLFGFSGIPLYLILWLVIPEARTTAEKLRMRGSKIDIENISRKVEEQFTGAAANVKSKPLRDGISKLLSGLGSLFVFIAHLLRIALGAFGLILGVVLAVALLVSITGISFGTNVPSMLTSGFLKSHLFFASWLYYLTWTGVLLVLAIPILALLYGGVRLILNLRSQIKGLSLTMIFALIVGSILLFTTVTFQLSGYSNTEQLEETHRLPLEDSDVLYIQVAPDPYWHKGMRARTENRLELVKAIDEHLIFGYPLLKVRPSDDDYFALTVVKKATGSNVAEAIDHAQNIEYTFQLNDSTLVLNPFYRSAIADHFRAQKVYLNVHVPNGRTVEFGPHIDRILRKDDGFTAGKFESASGKRYTNEQGTIQCQGCDVLQRPEPASHQKENDEELAPTLPQANEITL